MVRGTIGRCGGSGLGCDQRYLVARGWSRLDVDLSALRRFHPSLAFMRQLCISDHRVAALAFPRFQIERSGDHHPEQHRERGSFRTDHEARVHQRGIGDVSSRGILEDFRGAAGHLLDVLGRC